MAEILASAGYIAGLLGTGAQLIENLNNLSGIDASERISLATIKVQMYALMTVLGTMIHALEDSRALSQPRRRPIRLL